MNPNDISRRSFLRRTLAFSAAAAAVPAFWIPSRANAADGAKLVSPNEKVNLAVVGVGNRAADIARSFYATGLCNIVALCDVDMGAPHTKKMMEQFPDAPQFQDFRKMFDKMSDKIDAVSIGVPDHTHFPISIEAMARGKHVYVEKPLARTFQEIELLMAAERKFGVVTQMGNQGHSEANYFQFKAWVEAGIIKDVTAITAHMNSARRWHKFDPKMKSMPSGEPIPPTLDWDTWIGAAKYHEYNHLYHNGDWRCWYDYGMGALGDWGAHILDTAHEFLDMGLPYEVNPVYLKDHNPFFFPMSSTIEFKFPERGGKPPVIVTWYDGVDNIPPVPEGYGVSELDPNIPMVAGGKIQPAQLNPGKEIYSKDLIFKGGTHGSTLSIIPEERAKEMASKLPQVPKSTSNHFKNFLLSCMGKEKTRSPFSISGPLSQVFCLGVLSQRLNRKLMFDRDKKQIVNDSEANFLLAGVPRKGWEQYYKI